MSSPHRKNLAGAISVCLLALIAFLVYYFPLQRCLAQYNLGRYMEAQGVNGKDVVYIEYFKDYVQDGYYAHVAFSGDGHLYLYRYYLLSPQDKTGGRFNTMICDIYDHNRCLDGYEAGVKYPSLEWE